MAVPPVLRRAGICAAAVVGGLFGAPLPALAAGHAYHWSARSRHAFLADLDQTLGKTSVLFTGTVQASGGLDGTVHLQGAADPADGQEEVTVGVDAGSSTYQLHEIMSGQTLYLQAPGGQWYSLALSSLAHADNSLGSLFGESDPTDFLALVQQLGGQVANTGSSVLPDGTAVTDYHVLIDLDTLGQPGAQSGTAPRPAVRALEQILGSHTVAFDAQVDQQGRVRTLATNLTLSLKGRPGAAATGPIQVSLSLAFSGYGTPVTVTPPPPSAVQPLPSALAGMTAARLAL